MSQTYRPGARRERIRAQGIAVTPVAVAIERQDWTLASLMLLLGVVRAAEKLPAESLTELIDLLAAEDETKGARRGGR